VNPANAWLLRNEETALVAEPSPSLLVDALGGTDNYPVDRQAVDAGEDRAPGGMAELRSNRRFLERVVRYLVGECGIRQFIDNGSGLPTQQNVHQVAQSLDPAVRVVYIDNDPVVARSPR